MNEIRSELLAQAVVTHLGPSALAGGKLSAMEIFERGFNAGIDAAPVSAEPYKLPCAIRLPTGVTFGKGIDLDALIRAMNRCDVARFEDAPKPDLHLPSFAKGLQAVQPVNARLLRQMEYAQSVSVGLVEKAYNDPPGYRLCVDIGNALQEWQKLIGIAAEQSEPEYCDWIPDPDHDNMSNTWDGSCGIKWSLIEEGPTDNGMKFCPKCGRTLREAQGEGK